MPVVAALDLDQGVAAEPLVPQPALLQFASALSEAAIASFAAPAIAAGLEWVPYGQGRWRCPPTPDTKQLTFGDALGIDHGWLNVQVSLANSALIVESGDLPLLTLQADGHLLQPECCVL